MGGPLLKHERGYVHEMGAPALKTIVLLKILYNPVQAVRTLINIILLAVIAENSNQLDKPGTLRVPQQKKIFPLFLVNFTFFLLSNFLCFQLVKVCITGNKIFNPLLILLKWSPLAVDSTLQKHIIVQVLLQIGHKLITKHLKGYF